MTLHAAAATLLLLAVAAALWSGARSVRRRTLPEWSGAPAVLTDVLLVLGATSVVLQVLGAIGLFQLGPVVVALVAVGLGSRRFAERGAPPPTGPARGPAGPHVVDPSRWPVVGLVVALGAASASWIALVASGLSRFTDLETMRYRLPIAARFVQEGRLTELHLIDASAGDLIAVYPHLNETFHAVGILVFGTELGTFFLNPLLAVLALLSAWCIGRPYGTSVASTLGVLLTISTPMMVSFHAGNATNDLMVVTFVLASAAILVTADAVPTGSPGIAVAVAAIPAGIAVATKYTVLPGFLALTVVVVLASDRGTRLRRSVIWMLSATSVSALWYLRNLIEAGSPVPAMELKLGPIGFPSRPSPYESTSLASFLFDGEAWRSHLLPGLRLNWGPAAWLVGVALLVALVVSIVRPATARLRALSVTAAVMVAAYVVIPQPLNAPTEELGFFHYNVRYMAHGAALAMALLPTSPTLGSLARRRWLVGALVALVVVTQVDATIWSWVPFDVRYGAAASGAPAVAGLVGGAAVVLVGLALVSGRLRLRRSVPAAILAVALVTAGVVVVDRVHRPRRVLAARQQLPVFDQVWNLDGDDLRIGFVGMSFQFPFYGEDLDNHVQYIGEERDGAFVEIESCARFRTAINDGRYTHVVIMPDLYRPLSETAHRHDWVADDPAARVVPGGTQLFEIVGELDPGTCPVDPPGGAGSPNPPPPSG